MPCPSPSSSTSSCTLIEAWLQNAPPASSSPTDCLCKRHYDDDPSRNSSPKRQRVDADHVLPTQSALQVDSLSVMDLFDRTTLTAPYGSKRSSSPMRQLTELRTATPFVTLSSFNQMKQTPPVDITAHINKLRNHLRHRKGWEAYYIPAGPREAIETDVLFAPSLAVDPIDPEAYDYEDTRLSSD